MNGSVVLKLTVTRNPDLKIILDAQNEYDSVVAQKKKLEQDKVGEQAALDTATALGKSLADDAIAKQATIDANKKTIADMETQISDMRKKFKLFVFSG